MQGVIKSFDPTTGDGVVLCDADFADYDLHRDALEGSVFRMLRQGQRVTFDVSTGPKGLQAVHHGQKRPTHEKRNPK